MPGIHEPVPTRTVAENLRRRILAEVRGQDDDAVFRYLADAIYLERRRFSGQRGSLDEDDKRCSEAIEAAARASHQDRAAMERAIGTLVGTYAHEIHNRFSERTYEFATRILPGALTRLLTAASPHRMLANELLGEGLDTASRIKVQGPIDRIKALAQTHTLILAPTHLSNLDSPLIGYALHAAGLPPFIYGAGLNLFSNPAMSFFMGRLGAYTVDRRKKHQLYKDTLKAYSVDSLSRGCHSLFFPGGTRARSGRVEQRLKRGLLGTGITAWQEGLAAGRSDAEILVVPCTMSYSLTLEAETLIEDSLAEEGQARYIISDDEFSEPRTVASFAGRVLNLDASTYIRFGEPLDLVGNRVDEAGGSMDDHGRAVDRRGYVCDRAGKVVLDPQRDTIYTNRLSKRLVGAYAQDTVALSTHVAGFAAWRLLSRHHPRLDQFQKVLLGPAERSFPMHELLREVDAVATGVTDLASRDRVREAMPGGGHQGRAQAVLDEAIDRFGRFHTRRAIERQGNQALIDARLCLYYGNRLAHLANSLPPIS